MNQSEIIIIIFKKLIIFGYVLLNNAKIEDQHKLLWYFTSVPESPIRSLYNPLILPSKSFPVPDPKVAL